METDRSEPAIEEKVVWRGIEAIAAATPEDCRFCVLHQTYCNRVHCESHTRRDKTDVIFVTPAAYPYVKLLGLKAGLKASDERTSDAAG